MISEAAEGQAAYGGIAFSTGAQIATAHGEPASGVSVKHDPHGCADTVLERPGIDLEVETDPALLARDTAIRAHLPNKRETFGIRGDVVGALEDFKRIYGGRMFEPTKFVSADLRYTAGAMIRQRGSVTEQEIKNLQAGQKLDIPEAAVTENAAGLGDNALAGAALSAIPPGRSRSIRKPWPFGSMSRRRRRVSAVSPATGPGAGT